MANYSLSAEHHRHPGVSLIQLRLKCPALIHDKQK
jgi:hypothetical protein